MCQVSPTEDSYRELSQSVKPINDQEYASYGEYADYGNAGQYEPYVDEVMKGKELGFAKYIYAFGFEILNERLLEKKHVFFEPNHTAKELERCEELQVQAAEMKRSVLMLAIMTLVLLAAIGLGIYRTVESSQFATKCE